MDKLITLKSRGITNTLKRLDSLNNEGSCVYVLKPEYPAVRVGYDSKGIVFIDPPGGPMIIIGDVLAEVGKKVSNLTFDPNIGHIITFKD